MSKEKGARIPQDPLPVRNKNVMAGPINLNNARPWRAFAKIISLEFGKRLPQIKDLTEGPPRFLDRRSYIGYKISRRPVNRIDGKHRRTDRLVIRMLHHSGNGPHDPLGRYRPKEFSV